MAARDDQHDRVRAQYAPESGAIFYRQVMGDGGDDIHYGIYESDATLMPDACRAATLKLWNLALAASPNRAFHRIVDLGAGRGGAAHYLASLSAAHVTCVDLCPHHNRDNERRAQSSGLAAQIATYTGSFDELPSDWTARFDLVFSQEAICHADDKPAVFAEARRILRPRGVLAFSDVLLAEGAPPEEANAFTDVNAVVQLSTAAAYRGLLRDAGFAETCYDDWTPYLAANFARMRQQIAAHHADLVAAGVAAEFLDRFAAALERRLAWPDGAVLRWGAFIALAG